MFDRLESLFRPSAFGSVGRFFFSSINANIVGSKFKIPLVESGNFALDKGEHRKVSSQNCPHTRHLVRTFLMKCKAFS